MQPESFRSLPLRHRAQTGLIQRDLALRAGVSERSVQDWEASAKVPTVQRLRALIRALLEADGLTAGHEMSEARDLWTAAEREARRPHAFFDEVWFADPAGRALVRRRCHNKTGGHCHRGF
jgi:transcriptional regulator with XRE-family HTH domain